MTDMTHRIPFDALDDRLAIVGTSGSGKTYAAGTAVELVLQHKGRVIIVDPLGVWYGLRLLADGKTPSPHDVVIVGGESGDLPLNEHAGALIGETVAGIAQSVILDLCGIGTKAGARRFMLAFLTALHRHASRDPVHLVFDEADMWAPQRLLDKEGEAAKLLGQMETIVRRGRVLGFIPWLITQRPAVLSKDVLSQADGLVVMKLTSSQDRDAIGDWVEGQADKAQWRSMWASLPTLQVGHGLVWIPGRGVFATVGFPKKLTYDSSRAPKRGETRKTAVLRPLDLPTLREKLAAIEADAKANDPRELKAEIVRLKSEIQKLSVTKTDIIDPAAIEEADRRGYARGRADAAIEANRAVALFQQAWDNFAASYRAPPWERLSTAVAELVDKSEAALKADTVAPRGDAPVHRVAPSVAPQSPSRVKLVTPKPNGALPPGSHLPNPQYKILASLAFWKSVGHDAPTCPMIAAAAGYSPGSGGFNNLIGAMRTAGLLDIPAAGCVALTAAGSSISGSLSAGEARSFMMSVLSGPERKLVEAARSFGQRSGGADLTRDELASRTDYAPGSGGFNNLIGSLCTLNIFVKPRPGSVALSDWARDLLG